MEIVVRSEAAMLEKTFSFWRHLVGANGPAAPIEVQQDDRRLWVRYAADLQGNIQLGNGEAAEGILARIRDLSVGGASLLLDRALNLGQMVSLELRADRDETFSVLACVVRVVANHDDTWSIGCVFSRELSPEDLHRFGARKQASAETDQRTWVRFTSALQARYSKVNAEVTQAVCPASILNISPNGIGLSVQHAPQAGTLLNIDLLDSSGKIVRTLLACVVHTTRRAEGEYAIGCNFLRVLRDEELQSLLCA
jgi:hypothetical protein